MTDLEQTIRNFEDGLRTIRDVAGGLLMDVEDMEAELNLKLAQSAADLKESNEADRGRE